MATEHLWSKKRSRRWRRLTRFVLIYQDQSSGGILYHNAFFPTEQDGISYAQKNGITSYRLLTETEFQSYLQQKEQHSLDYISQYNEPRMLTKVTEVIEEYDEPRQPFRPRIQPTGAFSPVFIDFKGKRRRWRMTTRWSTQCPRCGSNYVVHNPDYNPRISNAFHSRCPRCGAQWWIYFSKKEGGSPNRTGWSSLAIPSLIW